MISTGRTNFRAMVEDKTAALDSLLDIVSSQIQEIEDNIKLSSNVEPDFLFDIKETFFQSIVKELYSLSEKGLGELSTLKKATWSKERGKRPTDIEIYYLKIQEISGNVLPPINEVWRDFEDFHTIRTINTHHKVVRINVERKTPDKIIRLTTNYLKRNIEQVKNMLLQAEQAVLDSKKM